MKPDLFSSVDYCLETAADAAAIERLHEVVFGDERFNRAAHIVRGDVKPDPTLCFVARENGVLVGSVRLTSIMIGKAPAYLLGPLCVLPALQGRGIGRKLVFLAIERVAKTDAFPIFLVGDAPYYQPLGFEKAPSGVKMPGWVDYDRVLVCWPSAKQNETNYEGMMRAVPSFER